MLFCRGLSAWEYSALAGGGVAIWLSCRDNESDVKETRWTQGQQPVEEDLRMGERMWNWAEGSQEEGGNNEGRLE